MSKTDAILAAVAHELEARRGAIDGDPGLRAVTLTVTLHGQTGQPTRVIFRPDCQKFLTKAVG